MGEKGRAKWHKLPLQIAKGGSGFSPSAGE